MGPNRPMGPRQHLVCPRAAQPTNPADLRAGIRWGEGRRGLQRRADEGVRVRSAAAQPPRGRGARRALPAARRRWARHRAQRTSPCACIGGVSTVRGADPPRCGMTGSVRARRCALVSGPARPGEGAATGVKRRGARRSGPASPEKRRRAGTTPSRPCGPRSQARPPWPP